MRSSGAPRAQRLSISAGVTPCLAASVSASSISRAVAVKPGQTLFTRTFDGPYSLASVFTRPLTPARMELERISPSTGCLTETEVIAIKRPQRCCCIKGSDSLARYTRSEEHTSELQSPCNLVCRLLLEKNNN